VALEVTLARLLSDRRQLLQGLFSHIAVWPITSVLFVCHAYRLLMWSCPQVVDPKIKAFMYTWGEGRITAEGERIPGGSLH
jgi:hypothetical protein